MSDTAHLQQHGNGSAVQPSITRTAEEVAAENAAKQQEAVGKGSDAINKLLHMPHPHVQMKETKFTFRKDKLGNKRAPITLYLPTPTIDGLAEALQDERQQNYVLSLLYDDIYKAARAQVDSEEKPVNEQSELNLEVLTLKHLAYLPPAERRGGGIAKEVWEAFEKDYNAVMPTLTGKEPERIANAATILGKKFQPVKTQKKIITFLREQLALWFSNSPNAEEYQEVYEFLDNKADELLKTDEAKLLENL